MITRLSYEPLTARQMKTSPGLRLHPPVLGLLTRRARLCEEPNPPKSRIRLTLSTQGYANPAVPYIPGASPGLTSTGAHA